MVREGPVPAPGAAVRLAVPDKGMRGAIVVFVKDLGIGLCFADEPFPA